MSIIIIILFVVMFLKMLMTLIDYFKYMNVDDHDICLNFLQSLDDEILILSGISQIQIA